MTKTPNNSSSPMQPEKPSQLERPSTKTLLEISKLLKTAPIPQTLSARPEIPRVLLTAARRGIHEDVQKSSGTAALIQSLITLSKASIIAKKRNENVRKPSPFSKTRAAQLGKAEMETINRAGSWATHVLAECVRGAPADSYNTAIIARVAHADITKVFVAPRDRLDIVLAQRYAKQATDCLDHAFFKHNPAALAKVHLFLKLTAAVSPRYINLCLPVFERAALSFASAPSPLLASAESSRNLDHLFEAPGASSNKLFEQLQLLSPEARAALCVASPLFRRMLREAIERLFASQNVLSCSAQSKVVNPLARAAVIDTNLHWEFMDEVRSLVSGREAPFSLRLWGQRRFFRALFSEIIRNSHHDELSNASLIKRFPPFGRPLVRLLSAMSDSLRSDDIRKQRKAAELAAKLITKMLNVEQQLIWTPNVHALMICVENFLELFCWAATFSFELDAVDSVRPEKRRKTRPDDVLTCISYLITLMETSRLPGGELVETEEQIRSSALSTRASIMQLYRKGQLSLADILQGKQITDLAGFALSGILGRQGIDMTMRHEKIQSEDHENLMRGLENGALWVSDSEALSRYERCMKNLANAVT